MAARGAGAAAAGLRPHRHVAEGKRESAGRRVPAAASSTARGSKRDRLPGPGRCNLLARLPGRGREGALLLLNHIDVVEAYPQFWKEAPPFEGRIKSGYLYGRGAYDMKSLGLAQALAMRRSEAPGHRAGDRHPLSRARPTRRSGSAGARAGCSSTGRSGSPAWRQVLNEGGTTEMILRERPLLGDRDAAGRLRARPSSRRDSTPRSRRSPGAGRS